MKASAANRACSGRQGPRTAYPQAMAVHAQPQHLDGCPCRLAVAALLEDLLKGQPALIQDLQAGRRARLISDGLQSPHLLRVMPLGAHLRFTRSKGNASSAGLSGWHRPTPRPEQPEQHSVKSSTELLRIQVRAGSSGTATGGACLFRQDQAAGLACSPPACRHGMSGVAGSAGP